MQNDSSIFIQETNIPAPSLTETGWKIRQFKDDNHHNISLISRLASEPTNCPEVKQMADMITAHITAADAIANNFFNYFTDL